MPGIERPAQSLHLTYEGRVVTAMSGDTVAAALINAGLLACRQANDGSLRGIFCGMGACNECAIVVDGHPGRLACMVQIEDGMIIGRQPPNSEPPKSVTPNRETKELSPSVLIVGGGPAGLSAAAIIAEAGVDVVLIDERPKLGGQFFKQPGPSRDIDAVQLDSQYQIGRKLIDRVVEAEVRIVKGVSIWGAFRPDLLVGDGDGVSWVFRPRRLILATGAIERAVPMPGWTLPGVMTTGAAQTLLRSSQVAPGQRVLLSGNGPLNLQVAAELTRAGVEVVALVEQADLGWRANLLNGSRMLMAAPELVKKGMAYRAALARARVPVIDRSSLVEIRGAEKVEAALVAGVDQSGHPVPGTEREYIVDAICVGYGFIPSNEIPRALGCDHHLDPDSGSLVTTCTYTGRTSVDAVWVVGDAGQIRGAYNAIANGALAGWEVLVELGAISAAKAKSLRGPAKRSMRRHSRFQARLLNVYDAPTLTTQLANDKTVVCRCESVALSELLTALSAGATSAGAAKRVTRAGMGNCQGRYCTPSILALAVEASGVPLTEFSGFAPQPPVRPLEIGRIADSVVPKSGFVKSSSRQERST